VSEQTPETPRRANVATVLQMLHEERMAFAAKRGGDVPTFAAKRATTSGALGVWELNVSVPVCDEYPTSEEAFAAQVEFMERLSAKFPLPDGKVRAT
jgi:hypothetical protein